jgi:hypothetical protein
MSGKKYLRNQNFFKPTYHEAIKYILPAYLYDDDLAETEKAEDPVDLIINSHLDVASNISSIIYVSAVPGTPYSNIDSLQGIAPFFIKQNELTTIGPKEFERDVLVYFGKRFRDFELSSEFEEFVDSTLLSSITLNNPDTAYFSSIGNASDIHNHLINKISWMYFLNTSGSSYSPSAYVRSMILDQLFKGETIKINDGIKGLSEHLWRNGFISYYPSSLFASGARADLSGTQQLDNLKTWIDVIYSPLYADRSDFKVRDKFEIYIDNSLKSSNKIESGPFARLIRALSLFAFDINNQTEQISTMYDIEECPDEYLPLIAQLIGWDLYSNDPNKWRLQLRNAVDIYKRAGTKGAIQATVDSVFPKNKFPIKSKITELWESYVPYLIYYSLATESKYFKSYTDWTRDVARGLEVDTYSTSSMDTNIRLAVDRIIFETLREFPDSFPINAWIEAENTLFNYRGRDYRIPPFEEYPYYVNTELNQPMIQFIADKLVCFGVRQEFALQVSSYLTTNSIAADEEPRAGSWLLFTSGYNEPPNLDNLIKNLSDNRFDYASLWSGKSSHFKLLLNASEFDFTKEGYNDTDSQDAITVVAKAVRENAPAHSIPIFTLEVSGDADSFGFEASAIPYVYLDREEIVAGAGKNTFASGIHFDTYKRGINTGGNVVGRSATQSLVSPEILAATDLGAVPRNTARRRSYEKVMPFNGYYDRTGFNMPVGFDMASGLSGIPLGLIPSSLTYTPVSSYLNLPDIWSQCEGLNSNNTYYEYDVSNTQNIRGQSANFQANTDRTTDRGQLPGIYAAIHRISENGKYLRSFIEFSGSFSSLENYLEDLLYDFGSTDTDPALKPGILAEILRTQALINGDYRSYTSKATNDSSAGYTFPESVDDFYNFEFGRDLHRLFNIYKDNFQWHRLSPDIQKQDGANLFSHTFGPLLYNHDFEKLGSVTSLVASSFADPAKISVTSAPFTGIGSFAASDASSMYLDTPERVSSGIVEALELVLTSGTNLNSSFSILKVPGSERASYEDPFLFDNTLVLMRSGNGATRMRFDISKYAAGVEHPVSSNFLSPEHEFKVNLQSIISKDSGLTLGGRAYGIWIHTKPENNSMWSYTKDGKWVQHSQLISRSDMFSKYSHVTNSITRANDPQSTSSSTSYACLDKVSSLRNSPVIGLGVEDLDKFEVTFNTRNRDILLPISYQKDYNQLHRLDQNYVIEVFMLPSNQQDQFMLVEKLEVQDLTMKKLSEIFAAGTLNDPLCVLDDLKKGCLEYRVQLTKQDLFDVFKHFNNLAGKNAATAYASRDKNRTETIMESEGGSRIDYRLSDVMLGTTYAVPTFLVYKTEVEIPI